MRWMCFTFAWLAGLAAIGFAWGQTPAPAQPRSDIADEFSREAANVRRGPDLPAIAYEDLVLLVETARNAFQDKIRGAAPRTNVYRPPALRDTKGIIHLILRSKGYSKAESESPELDIVDAALAAGTRLAEAALRKEAEIRDLRTDPSAFGLEFELLGPRQYLSAKFGEAGTWSDELLHSFEPAVEGIGVSFRGKSAWTRPSEVVSLNYTPDLAISAAESGAGLTHLDKLRFAEDIRYFRFRSYHLWQPSARVLPVVLTRGTLVVSPDSITAESLDAAIQRMGDYLRYRQNSSGGFAQEFLPGGDKYNYEGNSARVQMRALAGLAAYGAWCGRAEVIADAARIVRSMARYAQPFLLEKDTAISSTQPTTSRVETVEAGLVLWFPGHGDQLEISARMLMVLTLLGDGLPEEVSLVDGPATRPSAEGLGGVTSVPASGVSSRPADRALTTSQPALTIAELRRGLIDGLLAAQEADGRLAMSFEERPEGIAEDAASAGWALLALANVDPARSDRRIEQALTKALRHYAEPGVVGGSLAAAGVLARAFTQSYAWTNDARMSTYVFELLDRVVSSQVGPSNCSWPELHGAINAGELGAVGVDTAWYLAALSEGLTLAERVGDRDRAARYRSAAKAAARFVLQLEMREEGCYYVRSPRDAVGGTRAALWDHRLRVDYCADALVGLMKARAALYGDVGTGRK